MGSKAYFYLLLLCWISLLSCASKSAMLVHPQSGATVKCAAGGAGFMAVGTGRLIEECIASYEGQGYLPVERLTSEQRTDLQRRGILSKEKATP